MSERITEAELLMFEHAEQRNRWLVTEVRRLRALIAPIHLTEGEGRYGHYVGYIIPEETSKALLAEADAIRAEKP
jgi:hypothetical protein